MRSRKSILPLIVGVFTFLVFLAGGVLLLAGGQTVSGVLWLLAALMLGIVSLRSSKAGAGPVERESPMVQGRRYFTAAAAALEERRPALAPAEQRSELIALETRSGPAPAEAPAAPARPPAAGEAAMPDNLRKIEGIGPKIAGLLQAAGIATFARLAEADPERLRQVLDDAGSRYRLADPTTWPEQAALAAGGDWEALERLQGELKGGRRKA